MEIRVSLTEGDFIKLVNGEVAEDRSIHANEAVKVRIALQDIGFDRMQDALTKAKEKAKR